MKFTMNRMPIGLAGDAPLRIDEAEGSTVRVLRGRVWVTQEGSIDDVFLAAGAGHTFRGDGRVVVTAEGDAGATLVFDAPLTISEPATLGSMVRRLMTWRPAPRSISSNVYEGI